MEAVIAEARAAGVYDEGIADLRASSVTLKTQPEDVARDPATGAVTTLAQVSVTDICGVVASRPHSLDVLMCVHS